MWYSPGFVPLLGAEHEILTLHDLIHLGKTQERSLFYRAYYDFVIRPVVERTGVVITVSETSRVAIAEWLSTESVEVVNCGNGCSPAFRPDGRRFDFGSAYYLYVGNLKRHKHFSDLLDEMHPLRGLSLVAVVGDKKGAEELVESAGMRGRVRVVSEVTDEELASLYRGADATLFPSEWEGFGFPALESIACGTPVIFNRACRSVAEIVGLNGVGIDDDFSGQSGAWTEFLAAGDLPDVIDAQVQRWDDVACRVLGCLTEFEASL